MRLTVDFERAEQSAPLPGDGAALVAFMSFAVSRGFGAVHPLIALADRLQELKVPLGPLTTFYDRTPEDAEDREKLELAWQPAQELERSLKRMIEAVATDERARVLLQRSGSAGLMEEGEALRALIAAAPADERVRLVYDL